MSNRSKGAKKDKAAREALKKRQRARRDIEDMNNLAALVEGMTLDK